MSEESWLTCRPDLARAQVLENTLWNRQLGVMSEEIVAALVCQIFEGARPAARCGHALIPHHRCRTTWHNFVICTNAR